MDPTQISWQTQPEQAPDSEPPDAPLAKQEEDFIALAEEKARLEQLGTLPPDVTSEIPPSNEAMSPEGDMVDKDLLPGADAGQEQIVENDLTGGRKGGGFMGASVAGAGIQTADDPFGLKVTETAPPAAVVNMGLESNSTGRSGTTF